ncbi:unnamed protein product [Linum trigynum]|uniref:ADP-ribosyl cyclase/cyclic ADP-ribose hydrolase n=1 Tax=Linum trigynum TaxID=586398 RepID=A0AAV2GRW0_9ROSI
MLVLVLLTTLLVRPTTVKPYGFGSATNPRGADPPPLRYSSSLPPLTAQPPRWRHHVFLNFRGPDVRHTFTDHLYHALVRKGIKAFRDDRDIPRGENITEAIPRAIEESRFSILVLSRGYASSEWCLDELVKIMSCAKEIGHQPFPIFYNLSPDQVSNPSGHYKHDFDRYKREYSYERVHSWLAALAAIADISGWVLSESKSEAQLVEDIASSMLRKVVQELHGSSSITSVLPQSVRQSQREVNLHFCGGERNVTPDGVSATHECPAAARSKANDYEHLKFFKPEISPQGEKTVRIPKTVAEEGIKKYSQLGLLGQRLSSFDEGSAAHDQYVSILMKEANRLWSNRQSSMGGRIVGVQEVGGAGMYIFTFPDLETRDMVLESSPWCIANSSFVMRKWEPSMQFHRRSTTVPIWVRLVGVPVEYMTPKGLSYIASALGKPLYMDRATASGSQLAFAKVCVEIMRSPDDYDDQGFPTSISVAIWDGTGDDQGEVVVIVGVLYQWSMPCSIITTAAIQQSTHPSVLHMMISASLVFVTVLSAFTPCFRFDYQLQVLSVRLLRPAWNQQKLWK